MKINWKHPAILVLAFVATAVCIYAFRPILFGCMDCHIPHDLRVKAEAGDPRAQFKLGRTYLEHGYSDVEAKQIWSDAMVWFRRAADQGYGPAEFKVARCYQLGYCGEKDEVEAAKWFQKGAEHGYWAAQDSLCGDYYWGHGIKQDYEVAYFWKLVADYTRAEIGLAIVSGVPMPTKLTREQEEAAKKKVGDWEKTHPVPTRADQPEPNP